MSDLVEFLRARLDEQEASRWWFHKVDCVATVDEERLPPRRDCDCYYPARVLAEVVAKRTVLDHHDRWQATLHETPEGWTPGGCTAYRMAMQWTVQLLAQAWVDHPDFDPAWRT